MLLIIFLGKNQIMVKSENLVSMATSKSQTRINVIFVIQGRQDINLQSFKKILEMPFPGHFDDYSLYIEKSC